MFALGVCIGSGNSYYKLSSTGTVTAGSFGVTYNYFSDFKCSVPHGSPTTVSFSTTCKGGSQYFYSQTYPTIPMALFYAYRSVTWQCTVNTH